MADRILVVDDEQVVLDSVKRILRKDPVEVTTAETAEEALERIRGGDFSLVITDLMMPGMDGLELMRRLREMGSEVPIIMITGYPTIRTALQAKRLGAFEYVTKPFTRQELRSVVARALRPKQAQEAEQRAGGEQNLLVIPGHAWARPAENDTWLVGIEPEFAGTLAVLDRVKLPAINELVEQGHPCSTLVERTGVEHTVHAPLSGLVVEKNDLLEKEPDLARSDCRGRGWLFRQIPSDLEKETIELVPSGTNSATSPTHR